MCIFIVFIFKSFNVNHCISVLLLKSNIFFVSANEKLCTKEVTGLYVRNVPLDMRRDDINNVFQQCSQVLNIFLKIPENQNFKTTWAIVNVPSMK